MWKIAGIKLFFPAERMTLFTTCFDPASHLDQDLRPLRLHLEYASRPFSRSAEPELLILTDRVPSREDTPFPSCANAQDMEANTVSTFLLA